MTPIPAAEPPLDQVALQAAKHALAKMFHPKAVKDERSLEAALEVALRVAFSAYLAAAPSSAVTADVGALSAQDPLVLLEGLLRFGRSQDGAAERDLRAAITTLAARVEAAERSRDTFARALEEMDKVRAAHFARATAAEAALARALADVTITTPD